MTSPEGVTRTYTWTLTPESREHIEPLVEVMGCVILDSFSTAEIKAAATALKLQAQGLLVSPHATDSRTALNLVQRAADKLTESFEKPGRDVTGVDVLKHAISSLALGLRDLEAEGGREET